MTAEIVVMNKSAVALAADSAVTSSFTHKVFNSAEKLYMLLPGQPVGLLIYNNSEFMQLPWETIIKKYRNSSHNKSFGTLREYVDDFISFISKPNNDLYSEDQLTTTFDVTIAHYMLKIVKQIDKDVKKRIEDKAQKITGKEISQIISKWINEYYNQWNNVENRYLDEDVQKLKEDLLEYHDEIEAVRNSVFENALPLLSEDDKTKLEQFCYSLFYKKKVTDFHSGLIFAGFGENELYPSCVEVTMENYLCNYLKHTIDEDVMISPQNIAVIIPFAQGDIVTNFLEGIHPDFEESLREQLEGIFSPHSMLEIKKAMKGLRKEKRQAILDALEELKREYQDTLIKKVQSDFKEKHIDPVLLTVSMLPKDELAKMAESFVNITSFMRRVSIDVETVGGPIDVAVISKKDGFIWIKRKHYFDGQYNPHFNARYGGVS